MGCSIVGCSISNATAGVSLGLGFSTTSTFLTSSTFSTGTATSSVFERFTGSAQLGSGYCSSCKIRLATGFSAGAGFSSFAIGAGSIATKAAGSSLGVSLATALGAVIGCTSDASTSISKISS